MMLICNIRSGIIGAIDCSVMIVQHNGTKGDGAFARTKRAVERAG